jgi:hypothetical protein
MVAREGDLIQETVSFILNNILKKNFRLNVLRVMLLSFVGQKQFILFIGKHKHKLI